MDKNLKLIFKTFTVGIKVSALISLLIFSGIKIDHFLNITPLFTIIFSLTAIITSYLLAGRFFMKNLINKTDNSSRKDS